MTAPRQGLRDGQQDNGGLGLCQLAAVLRTPVASLYRAGELGLLPVPDQAGGRWSAEAVARIVDGWPQTAAAIEAARELGAARSAELLARATGLPVARRHVEELAARGLLRSSRSYRHRPLYRVAEVEALAVDPVTRALLAEITAP
jgi:hypothetical protein